MKKKITCPGCNAVYNIPINKLHKEVSRTTCRKCGHKIEVRKPNSSEFLIKDGHSDNTIPTPRNGSDLYGRNEQKEDEAFQMSPFSTEQFPPNPFEEGASANVNISPNQFRSDYQDPSQPADDSITRPAPHHSSPIAVKTTQTSHYRGLFAIAGFGGLIASVFLPDLNSVWYGLIALGLSVPFFNALWPHTTKTPSLAPILGLSVLSATVFAGGHFALERDSLLDGAEDTTKSIASNDQKKSQPQLNSASSQPSVIEKETAIASKEEDVVKTGKESDVVKKKSDISESKNKEKAKNTKNTKNTQKSKSIERIKSKHREKRKLEKDEGPTPKADPYKFNEGSLQNKSKKEGEQSISSLDQTFAEEQKKEENSTEIPTSVIHTMLHNNKGIFACYREHRSLTGQYPSGVKIRFEVTSSGTIPKAFIVDGPFVGSRFEVCLRKAMREIVFPPTQGDTKEYEYNFRI
jgi:hypothetical protein